MDSIKNDLEELNKKLEEYKPGPGEGRKYNLIRGYISLALNAAAFKSRVKEGSPEQAAKLNPIYKDSNIIEQQTEAKKENTKKRGRPKKKKENVLASSSSPKTLTDKLKNDAK